MKAYQWIKSTKLLQDIIKDLITYNAIQLKYNQSRFKLNDLKIIYIDIHSRHNWTYDNPMRLMHHMPKLTH